jgi:hypothetical protein
MLLDFCPVIFIAEDRVDNGEDFGCTEQKGNFRVNVEESCIEVFLLELC